MSRLLKWGWPGVVAVGLLWVAVRGFEAKEPAGKGVKDITALHESLKDVINRGAKIFNEDRDHAGCYRIFEGALISVRPLLEKDLQTEVDAALVRASRHASFTDKAFELRRALDLIRERHQPVWYRLGGEAKVFQVVEDFVKAVQDDPKIDFDRKGTIKVNLEALKVEMVKLISEITGGPHRYTGKDMKDAHKGMRVSDEEFRRTLRHMEDALKKNGAQPKDIAVIVGAMEATHKEIVEKKSPPLPGDKGPLDKADDKGAVKDKDKDKVKDKGLGKDKATDKDKLPKDKKADKVEIKDKKEKPEVKDKKPDPTKDKKDKAIETKDKDKKEFFLLPGEVKGTITYDGKAVGGGTIVFVPVDGDKKTASGNIAGGRYAINLVQGKYFIGIEAAGLPGKYKDPEKSGLTFRVSPGSQEFNIGLSEPAKEGPKDDKGKGAKDKADKDKKPVDPIKDKKDKGTASKDKGEDEPEIIGKVALRARVEGKITLKGKPIGEGFVVYWSERTKSGYKGIINKDGTYQIPELPEGEYRIMVLPARKDDKTIPLVYSNQEKTMLRSSVRAGANTMDLDLR